MSLKEIITKERVAYLLIFPFSLFSWFFSPADLGMYRSNDAGNSWQAKIAVNRGVSISSVSVLSVAIDPINSRTVYVGTRGRGLYKSQDGGEHWYQVKDMAGQLAMNANIYKIIIDPDNTNNVYLGTYQNRRGRFFRSVDGGQSFRETYVVSDDKYAIFAVEIDPINTSTVYMGTAQGGLLKSVNGGQSWRVIKWFGDVIADIKTDPRNTSIIYVATYNHGIYKTYNRGASWVSLEDRTSEFQEANELEQIIMDPEAPNTLYLATTYGLLKSYDGGDNWQSVEIIIPERSLPILSVAVSFINSKLIYYSAGSAIYKSTNGGVDWSVDSLPSTRNAKVIAFDPTDPDIMFIGMHK
ncbi:MAG: hypothetical protein COU81_01035 [Candidatus Portnoybacteria bacterium CG10_big_fil_rev_8_21_14_0_10_36_7]|uniref:Sortilin N-terminal domain-containing protein n=1 Tax=Candidatus Portnoybacteria bacterium CG10_big_fil_rev_8_21_14_0_10_36_7 TaxID=1974812 RepID=A0A2M8KEN2_9BACT|nr:MAG: hypothetical protein COU81_01035 [Candidatus Portnoybacteria bacterium CG10_big_fil_rev_8_21_14_0_10_36_7]